MWSVEDKNKEYKTDVNIELPDPDFPLSDTDPGMIYYILSYIIMFCTIIMKIVLMTLGLF